MNAKSIARVLSLESARARGQESGVRTDMRRLLRKGRNYSPARKHLNCEKPDK